MTHLSHSLASHHFISFHIISGLELLNKYEKENAVNISGGGGGAGGFSSSRPVQGKVNYMRQRMTVITIHRSTCSALVLILLGVDQYRVYC